MIDFTPGELALDRAPFDASLPDRCTVQRYAATPDGAGGYTETWTADAHDVACRVAPVSGQQASETLGAGRPEAVQQYVGTLTAGTPLRAADRVSWDSSGRVLQVVGPGGRSRELSRRFRAVEVV